MPTQAKPTTLPSFVEPMLATLGDEPFDRAGWCFEIKWDGFRSIARIDSKGCRLIGRKRTDFTSRFGGLANALAKLPAGTILDGEIIALKPDGTQDFTTLLRRGAKTVPKGLQLCYVAFDLLYERGRSLMGETLRGRQDRLRPLIRKLNDPAVLLSEGVEEEGKAYFQQAAAAGLEGVMAKRLGTIYRPGVRTGDWIKLKVRHQLIAAIIGYEPSAAYGLKSLVIATPHNGQLRCAGQVGSGIAPAMMPKLLSQLHAAEQPRPVVACSGIKAKWVEPRLMCRVSYAEMLTSGKLRQPVFEGLISNVR